jgi:hypothetical protein
MKISHQKTKIMALKGTEPIRSKIVIDKILEQVNTFTYLGCNILYQKEKDIHSKITTFLQILGLLNDTLKPNLVQRSTRLKLYKILALPTFLYCSESWTIEQCDKRRTPCHTLRRQIMCMPTKWFQHVLRMEDNRLPKQQLNYHPKGR